MDRGFASLFSGAFQRVDAEQPVLRHSGSASRLRSSPRRSSFRTLMMLELSPMTQDEVWSEGSPQSLPSSSPLSPPLSSFPGCLDESSSDSGVSLHSSGALKRLNFCAESGCSASKKVKWLLEDKDDESEEDNSMELSYSSRISKPSSLDPLSPFGYTPPQDTSPRSPQAPHKSPPPAAILEHPRINLRLFDEAEASSDKENSLRIDQASFGGMSHNRGARRQSKPKTRSSLRCVPTGSCSLTPCNTVVTEERMGTEECSKAPRTRSIKRRLLSDDGTSPAKGQCQINASPVQDQCQIDASLVKYQCQIKASPAQDQCQTSDIPVPERCDSFIGAVLSKPDENGHLVGDFSAECALPLTRGRHKDLKCISADTMAAVLRLDYDDVISQCTIVDCRYPYEYQGGHIEGSKNLCNEEAVLSEFFTDKGSATGGATAPRRTIIIFHCEFSSERAPKLLRFMRNHDRALHSDSYPSLSYPELYLLEGGYKAFFEAHCPPLHCEPPLYTPMLHEAHAADLRHFRAKSKSWGGAQRRAQQFLVRRVSLHM